MKAWVIVTHIQGNARFYTNKLIGYEDNVTGDGADDWYQWTSRLKDARKFDTVEDAIVVVLKLGHGGVIEEEF